MVQQSIMNVTVPKLCLIDKEFTCSTANTGKKKSCQSVWWVQSSRGLSGKKWFQVWHRYCSWWRYRYCSFLTGSLLTQWSFCSAVWTERRPSVQSRSSRLIVLLSYTIAVFFCFNTDFFRLLFLMFKETTMNRESVRLTSVSVERSTSGTIWKSLKEKWRKCRYC